MKPYCKTFRAAKTHKASECDICSEDTKGGPKSARREGKKAIADGVTERDELELAPSDKQE